MNSGEPGRMPLWSETAEHSPLAAEITALPSLDLYALRVVWRKTFSKQAPAHLGRALLIRILAYRKQAKVHGDLDSESRSVLEDMLHQHQNKKEVAANHAEIPQTKQRPYRRPHRPGTVFLREHAGEMHRVTVIKDGFEWKGQSFTSLSQIAKAITGTSWNGPRFFGLREGRKAEASGADATHALSVTPRPPKRGTGRLE